MEEERSVERRKSGWTMWREILGTFIGAAALVVPIAIGAYKYITEHGDHLLRHDGQIDAIIKLDAMREAARLERNSDLDKRFLRYEIQQDRIESKLDRVIERK